MARNGEQGVRPDFTEHKLRECLLVDGGFVHGETWPIDPLGVRTVQPEVSVRRQIVKQWPIDPAGFGKAQTAHFHRRADSHLRTWTSLISCITCFKLGELFVLVVSHFLISCATRVV